MNVGTGMGLIGIIDLNLQRVPEPGPMILMAVSALLLGWNWLGARSQDLTHPHCLLRYTAQET